MSKNGFSYYKAETDRFQDIKIKRLKKKYGCDGYAVYQYALNEIYRVEGAYIRWTEDQLFDCADYWDMNEARVKEIIGYCAEVCLFDPVMWKTQCILTSRAIQSRYLDICKISKKKSYIPLENPACRTGTADEGACSDATLRRRGRGGGTRYTESGNIGQ